MTLQEAMKKAIDGGYSSGRCEDDIHGIIYDNVYKALLDPEFWKSYGKAMGWNASDEKNAQWWKDRYPYGTWYMKWESLIYSLVKGNSIESFFEQFEA